MTQPYVTQKHANLTDLNSMALASTAQTLVNIYDEQDVPNVINCIKASNTQQAQSADRQTVPAIFVLSAGSNVLLPPQLNATVIRPLFTGITVLDDDDDSVCIEVMAGNNWHKLVLHTVANGWYGLENLALIPGLVGAAPVQNIGAYGVQLDDSLTHVRAYHLPTLTWHTLSKADCQFDYRDSLFKQQAGQWLITRVGFKLHKNVNQVCANYGDVQTQALQLAANNNRSQISPVDVMHAIISIRQSKLPDPKVLPNCGSFFKNPIIPISSFNQLKTQFTDMVGYRVDDDYIKVAAGWLIDNAGLKGGGIAPILTHDKQALVLTNHAKRNQHGHADCDGKAYQIVTQKHVAATQAYIQHTIYDKYGITLEREPVWINTDGSINAKHTI